MIWKPIVHGVDGQTTDLDIVTIVEIIVVKSLKTTLKNTLLHRIQFNIPRFLILPAPSTLRIRINISVVCLGD